jgi:hypothetical protein
MKEWLIRVFLLALLAAVGLWAWHTLYPNPEKVIRKRLGELAKAASFSSKQGFVSQAWDASSLGGFFTLDVEVTLDVPGLPPAINGRDELLAVAGLARKSGRSVTVEFPDIKVTVAPDKSSAVVYLTGKAKVSGERDFFLQEVRLRLIKVKRDWLIRQIETVKTLSWGRDSSVPLPAASWSVVAGGEQG